MSNKVDEKAYMICLTETRTRWIPILAKSEDEARTAAIHSYQDQMMTMHYHECDAVEIGATVEDIDYPDEDDTVYKTVEIQVGYHDYPLLEVVVPEE